MRKKILVTGGSGQVGSEIKFLSKNYCEFEFVFSDRYNMNLADEGSIKEFLYAIKPDYVINCGAYTAVDLAEKEMVMADLVNHKAVQFIGEWCAKNEAKVIHISTDYVFDGKNNSPLTEDALTSPINVYGKTKLEGENALIGILPSAIIIRTAWVYSTYGKNFVRTMCKLMSERETINVVNDQIGTPTYARDLANVILSILSSKEWLPGIYNYTNEGEISWYDFACKIKEIMGYNCVVNPVCSNEFPTLAKRPSFSLLCKDKIKETFNIEIPLWNESLLQMLSN